MHLRASDHYLSNQHFSDENTLKGNHGDLPSACPSLRLHGWWNNTICNASVVLEARPMPCAHLLLWGGLRIRYDIEGERRRAFERVGHHDNTASAGLDISIAIKKS